MRFSFISSASHFLIIFGNVFTRGIEPFYACSMQWITIIGFLLYFAIFIVNTNNSTLEILLTDLFLDWIFLSYIHLVFRIDLLSNSFFYCQIWVSDHQFEYIAPTQALMKAKILITNICCTISCANESGEFICVSLKMWIPCLWNDLPLKLNAFW